MSSAADVERKLHTSTVSHSTVPVTPTAPHTGQAATLPPLARLACCTYSSRLRGMVACTTALTDARLMPATRLAQSVLILKQQHDTSTSMPAAEPTAVQRTANCAAHYMHARSAPMPKATVATTTRTRPDAKSDSMADRSCRVGPERELARLMEQWVVVERWGQAMQTRC